MTYTVSSSSFRLGYSMLWSVVNSPRYFKKSLRLNIVLNSFLRYFLRFFRMRLVKWVLYSETLQIKLMIFFLVSSIYVFQKKNYKRRKFKFALWNKYIFEKSTWDTVYLAKYFTIPKLFKKKYLAAGFSKLFKKGKRMFFFLGKHESKHGFKRVGRFNLDIRPLKKQKVHAFYRAMKAKGIDATPEMLKEQRVKEKLRKGTSHILVDQRKFNLILKRSAIYSPLKIASFPNMQFRFFYFKKIFNFFQFLNSAFNRSQTKIKLFKLKYMLNIFFLNAFIYKLQLKKKNYRVSRIFNKFKKKWYNKINTRIDFKRYTKFSFFRTVVNNLIQNYQVSKIYKTRWFKIKNFIPWSNLFVSGIFNFQSWKRIIKKIMLQAFKKKMERNRFISFFVKKLIFNDLKKKLFNYKLYKKQLFFRKNWKKRYLFILKNFYVTKRFEKNKFSVFYMFLKKFKKNLKKNKIFNDIKTQIINTNTIKNMRYVRKSNLLDLLGFRKYFNKQKVFDNNHKQNYFFSLFILKLLLKKKKSKVLLKIQNFLTFQNFLEKAEEEKKRALILPSTLNNFYMSLFIKKNNFLYHLQYMINLICLFYLLKKKMYFYYLKFDRKIFKYNFLNYFSKSIKGVNILKKPKNYEEKNLGNPYITIYKNYYLLTKKNFYFFKWVYSYVFLSICKFNVLLKLGFTYINNKKKINYNNIKKYSLFFRLDKFLFYIKNTLNLLKIFKKKKFFRKSENVIKRRLIIEQKSKKKKQSYEKTFFYDTFMSPKLDGYDFIMLKNTKAQKKIYGVLKKKSKFKKNNFNKVMNKLNIKLLISKLKKKKLLLLFLIKLIYFFRSKIRLNILLGKLLKLNSKINVEKKKNKQSRIFIQSIFLFLKKIIFNCLFKSLFNYLTLMKKFPLKEKLFSIKKNINKYSSIVSYLILKSNFFFKNQNKRFLKKLFINLKMLLNKKIFFYFYNFTKFKIIDLKKLQFDTINKKFLKLNKFIFFKLKIFKDFQQLINLINFLLKNSYYMFAQKKFNMYKCYSVWKYQISKFFFLRNKLYLLKKKLNISLFFLINFVNFKNYKLYSNLIKTFKKVLNKLVFLKKKKIFKKPINNNFLKKKNSIKNWLNYLTWINKNKKFFSYTKAFINVLKSIHLFVTQKKIPLKQQFKILWEAKFIKQKKQITRIKYLFWIKKMKQVNWLNWIRESRKRKLFWSLPEFFYLNCICKYLKNRNIFKTGFHRLAYLYFYRIMFKKKKLYIKYLLAKDSSSLWKKYQTEKPYYHRRSKQWRIWYTILSKKKYYFFKQYEIWNKYKDKPEDFKKYYLSLLKKRRINFNSYPFSYKHKNKKYWSPRIKYYKNAGTQRYFKKNEKDIFVERHIKEFNKFFSINGKIDKKSMLMNIKLEFFIKKFKKAFLNFKKSFNINIFKIFSKKYLNFFLTMKFKRKFLFYCLKLKVLDFYRKKLFQFFNNVFLFNIKKRPLNFIFKKVLFNLLQKNLWNLTRSILLKFQKFFYINVFNTYKKAINGWKLFSFLNKKKLLLTIKNSHNIKKISLSIKIKYILNLLNKFYIFKNTINKNSKINFKNKAYLFLRKIYNHKIKKHFISKSLFILNFFKNKKNLKKNFYYFFKTSKNLRERLMFFKRIIRFFKFRKKRIRQKHKHLKIKYVMELIKTFKVFQEIVFVKRINRATVYPLEFKYYFKFFEKILKWRQLKHWRIKKKKVQKEKYTSRKHKVFVLFFNFKKKVIFLKKKLILSSFFNFKKYLPKFNKIMPLQKTLFKLIILSKIFVFKTRLISKVLISKNLTLNKLKIVFFNVFSKLYFYSNNIWNSGINKEIKIGKKKKPKTEFYKNPNIIFNFRINKKNFFSLFDSVIFNKETSNSLVFKISDIKRNIFHFVFFSRKFKNLIFKKMNFYSSVHKTLLHISIKKNFFFKKIINFSIITSVTCNFLFKFYFYFFLKMSIFLFYIRVKKHLHKFINYKKLWLNKLKYKFWLEQKFEKLFNFNCNLKLIQASKAITKFLRKNQELQKTVEAFKEFKFYMGWRRRLIINDILWCFYISCIYFCSSLFVIMIGDFLTLWPKHWGFLKKVRFFLRYIMRFKTFSHNKLNSIRYCINGKINGGRGKKKRTISYTVILSKNKGFNLTRLYNQKLIVDYSNISFRSLYGSFGMKLWLVRY